MFLCIGWKVFLDNFFDPVVVAFGTLLLFISDIVDQHPEINGYTRCQEVDETVTPVEVRKKIRKKRSTKDECGILHSDIGDSGYAHVIEHSVATETERNRHCKNESLRRYVRLEPNGESDETGSADEVHGESQSIRKLFDCFRIVSKESGFFPR